MAHEGEDGEDERRVRAELENYLQTHNINELFSRIIERCLIEQPEDPITFSLTSILDTYPSNVPPSIARAIHLHNRGTQQSKIMSPDKRTSGVHDRYSLDSTHTLTKNSSSSEAAAGREEIGAALAEEESKQSERLTDALHHVQEANREGRSRTCCVSSTSLSQPSSSTSNVDMIGWSCSTSSILEPYRGLEQLTPAQIKADPRLGEYAKRALLKACGAANTNDRKLIHRRGRRNSLLCASTSMRLDPGGSNQARSVLSRVDEARRHGLNRLSSTVKGHVKQALEQCLFLKELDSEFPTALADLSLLADPVEFGIDGTVAESVVESSLLIVTSGKLLLRTKDPVTGQQEARATLEAGQHFGSSFLLGVGYVEPRRDAGAPPETRTLDRPLAAAAEEEATRSQSRHRMRRVWQERRDEADRLDRTHLPVFIAEDGATTAHTLAIADIRSYARELYTMHQEARMVALRGIPLLSAFSEHMLTLLSKKAQDIFVLPGEVCIVEGEMNDRVYAVVAGTGVVSRQGVDLGMIEKGCYFGDKVVLAGDARLCQSTLRGGDDCIVQQVGGLKSMKAALHLISLERSEVMDTAEANGFAWGAQEYSNLIS